jgi:hypothetical protein
VRLSSRRYLKRVWRVPKDRGPVEYLGTLVVKALRKHGWPAELQVDAAVDSQFGSFSIYHDAEGFDGPADFLAAVSIAVRIVSAQKKVLVHEEAGHVTFWLPYTVTPSGDFKETPQE